MWINLIENPTNSRINWVRRMSLLIWHRILENGKNCNKSRRRQGKYFKLYFADMAFLMTCLVVYDDFASLQYWLDSNYFASCNKTICIHPFLSLSLLVAKYNPLLINSRQLSNSFLYSNSHTNNVHKTPITWTLRSRTPRYEKVFFFSSSEIHENDKIYEHKRNASARPRRILKSSIWILF